jgi:P4 family phage/plasmid primase-like protien
MLTWDDEVTSQIHRVVETAHYPELPFTIMQIEPGEDGELKFKTYHCTRSEHAARMKADGLELFEAYFAPCASNDSSMRIGNFTKSWAVAVDFDHGMPDLCLPGQPLAPTIAIATSEGRYHCIWQLTEPILAHRMGRLAKVMAKRLGGDMAFARVNQMVRLPRFRNRKYGTVVLLREDLCSGAEYSPDFLWKACDGALYEAGIAISSPQINHIHPHVLRDRPDLTLKHARAAVGHLKNRRYAENYATWFKVLVNLPALGNEGRLIALAFSEGSPKFNADAFEKKWSSVCKSGNGALSTLFAMAQKEGWKNPGWSDSDDSETAHAITDREFGARVAAEMADAVVALDGEPSARGVTTQFYAWDGTVNRLLTTRQKRTHVAAAAAAVIKRGRQAGNEAAWKAHEKKLGSNKLLEEVCEHVSEALVPTSEPRIVSGAPYLAVANGVVNLLTRQLVPVDYRAVAKVSAPVTFDPAAKAERFLRFLNEVLEEDQTMIAYVVRVLGYALMGNPVEQVMFILLGPSENGKSTLMEVVLAILGPLAGRLRTETLMQKSHVNDGANPALAKLKGSRVLVIAEPNRTHKLDTSLVKQLTGEKKIYVRGLYSGGEEIAIECCLFMTANFMPFAEAQDKGLWRRIRVIPFDRTFRPDQINRNLTEELKAEASGILNLLLGGLADYVAQGGLNPPEKVVQAVGALQQEADALEVFLQERCAIDHMKSIKLKDLWAAYMDWAKLNSKFRVLTKVEMMKRLQGRFNRETHGHLPIFMGLTLATD